ncbi:hypothetical protein GCM10023200_45740 [Actinomycetospora chlora]|uniref:Uncharacterized protein n=1 Tax=Actinomycetospora chlora TaxID=663608 RepID=A0ABP9C4A2_9PSEU
MTAPPLAVPPAALASLGRLRDTARTLGRQLDGLAEREDVARHPVLVRALRNVAGLPDRPPHELALGVVTLGIMIATDSIVVDIAANVVAVLFVNHPHPVAADAAATEPAR